MTDVQNSPMETPETTDNITKLKRKADLLGVSYKSNTSEATLIKNIKEKMEANEALEQEGTKETKPSNLKRASAKDEESEDAYTKSMKLVRVQITPIDPMKANSLDCEMFTAGNNKVGTVTRTIPFGVPWHIENILYNSILEKRYQAFVTRKINGNDVTIPKLMPAYNVIVLPDLTEEELSELAKAQQRSGSLLED